MPLVHWPPAEQIMLAGSAEGLEGWSPFHIQDHYTTASKRGVELPAYAVLACLKVASRPLHLLSAGVS